ncbi:MAG TPA: serine/threonine-protein kinase, partial [Kofleriaceae bacterium]
MDCDDVMLMVAVGEGRTLSGAEEREYHQHVETCETCRALTVEASSDKLRWVARIPEDALDDPDLLVLPMVDPIVFAIGDELARGGMGRITRARDRRLGRDVAIKEVLVPYLRARFEREAMITARLQHPAIVPVYEAGTWPDGSAFYTMRLVSGGTLADAIARTHTLEERLALLPHVLAVTEALGYAHAHRIVHRDLKPGNVLVGEFGETVVIDWGLAKDVSATDNTGTDPPLRALH